MKLKECSETKGEKESDLRIGCPHLLELLQESVGESHHTDDVIQPFPSKKDCQGLRHFFLIQPFCNILDGKGRYEIWDG